MHFKVTVNGSAGEECLLTFREFDSGVVTIGNKGTGYAIKEERWFIALRPGSYKLGKMMPDPGHVYIKTEVVYLFRDDSPVLT